MYTVEQLEEMDGHTKRDYLERLAIEHFQTDRWKAAYARSIGRKPMTVSQWYMGETAPPTWAILLLQAFKEKEKAVIELNQAKQAVDDGIRALLTIKATFAPDETA